MSSYLFYSSPPPAAHTEQQLSFFTPQVHRTTPFAAWPSFQPKSPSPLRTSHANVPRRQPYMTEPNSKHLDLGFEIGDENTAQEHGDNSHANSRSQAQTSATTPLLDGESTTIRPTTSTQNIFTSSPFTSSTPSASNSTRTPFQFQQRARDSSAQSLLSSRISSSRASRASSFVSRLRNARRDGRDDRHIESFEKAEYWRERRHREERMQRDAQRALGEIWEDDADMLGPDTETKSDQLSPVTEEREVEELVNAYYEGGALMESGGPEYDHGNVDMDDSDGFEDDTEYEEAFMEVLSQEQRGGMGPQSGSQDSRAQGSGMHGHCGESVPEGDMDMT